MKLHRIVFAVLLVAAASGALAADGKVLLRLDTEAPDAYTKADLVRKPAEERVPEDGTLRIIEFGTTDEHQIFKSDQRTAEIYGGWLIRYFDPEDKLGSGQEPRLHPNRDGWAPRRYVSFSGAKNKSRQVNLLLWRKDQMALVNLDEPLKLGADSAIRLRILEATDGELHFVIRNGDTYYLSETVFKGSVRNTEPKLVELKGVGGSDEEGKRWAEFKPEPKNFDLPDQEPEWKGVTFDDVREVGLLYVSERDQWAHGFMWNLFEVTREE
jgi:hypothetical protein